MGYSIGQLFSAVFALIIITESCSAQTPNQTAPTFDCAKVTASLPRLICSSETAALADWELSSAFWALLPSLDAAAQSSLNKTQDEFFRSLIRRCALPTASGPFRPSPSQVTCVVGEYRSKAAAYRSRLSADALAEANLSPDRHKQVQSALIALRLLNGKAEGVFGRQTRTAIKTFQANNNFAQTGFLTAAQRQALFQQSEKSLSNKKSGEPVPALPKVEAANSNPLDPPLPAVPDQPSPPLQAVPQDSSACSGAATVDAVTACSRLLGEKDLGPALIRLYLLKRAASQEGLSNQDAAFQDYNRVLSLFPGDPDATAGQRRVEDKSPSAADPTIATDDRRPQGAAPSNPNRVAIFVLALVVVLLTVIGIREPDLVNSIRQHLLRWARPAGAVSALIVICATIFFLRFGNTQSVLAVSAPMHHVPQTAQGYLAIPHLGSFLESAKAYLESSTAAIDRSRLAKALGANPDDIDALLGRFRSIQTVVLRNEQRTMPIGCLDFSSAEDRSIAGIQQQTAAAAFIGNRANASPIAILGPVDKDRFSAYLANSTSEYLIDLHPPTNVENSKQGTFRLESWSSNDFRLCRHADGVKLISAGSEFPQGDAAHSYLTLQPIAALRKDSSFQLSCSYGANGQTYPCGCEVLERLVDGTLTPLGNCDKVGKAFATQPEKPDLANVISTGGTIAAPISFSFPLLGRFRQSTSIKVVWQGDTVIIGQEPALADEATGTPSAQATSIVRDDSFVTRYKQVATDPTGFLALVRPDFDSRQSFLSKMVTLPVILSGTVLPDTLSVQAAISFEPLDAKILQDISRDFSAAAGTLPIRTSAGSASIRIGDNRVKQYVSFADAFILNRLIEGLSRLDIQSAVRALKVNFTRYLLFKVGARDESAPASNSSIADQPIQIILLDDAPNAWAPSAAVAVKFQTFAAAQSFLCAEASDVQRLFDKRMLLNAVRSAKSKARLSAAYQDYKATLEQTMKSLLGEKDWTAYTQTYEIDPFLATVADPIETGPPANVTSCSPSLSGVSIGGRDRDVYYLSPATTKLIETFYFRVPELTAEIDAGVASLDQQLATLSVNAKEAEEKRNAIAAASTLLDKIMVQLQPLPAASPLPASILAQVSALRSTMEKAEIGRSLPSWPTVALARDDLADGSLKLELTNSGQSIIAVQQKITDDIADARVQREVSSQRAGLISKAIVRDDQRIVGFIDSQRRILYIASSLDALKRAAEQAATDPPEPSTALLNERIRLYASGDNTVQSILDLWPDDTQVQAADRWRNAKRDGPLLPFGVGYLGLSGQHNGVAVSLNLARQRAKDERR